MGSDLALAPVYDEIDAGVRYDFENVPRLRHYVNFGTSVEHPIHGWYYFKEGFAPGMVHWALQRFLLPRWPDHVLQRGARRAGREPGPLVLDPFAGSGTTPLTCQIAGLDARGVEYNPFFAFLGQAKLRWCDYNVEALREAAPELLRAGGTPTLDPPALSSFQRLFSPETLADLLLMKERIAALDSPLDRQFFQIGLAAIVERASIARKDGKGLKVVRRPFVPVPVREGLYGQWTRMMRDLDAQADGRERAQAADVTIERGDARGLTTIADASVDLVVYSPPYLNSFDYSEVYKLEMWLLDFVQDQQAFRDLRGAALRSHVSTPIAPTAYLHYPPLAALIEVIDQQRLWNRRIPDMIRGYFDDMFLVLREQARVLKPGCYLVCVVANSAYGGVPIPTDTILARIGERHGLEIDGIYVARRMNTSAQQLAQWRSGREYLRESAVVLRKPEH